MPNNSMAWIANSCVLPPLIVKRSTAMGSTLPPLDEELYRRTDEVLHYVWDPIGIATAPEARDEYYSYLPQVFSLVKAKADAEAIAAHLTDIATKRMGLTNNHKHDLVVAELLLYWQQVINDKSV